jgi:pyrroloquinoline quinone (PQQ) biosynthesis protein C
MNSLLYRSLSAVQTVESLTRIALRHRAVRHPYLRAIANGSFPDPSWALADFARQYQGYSVHFPRYLTALLSRLENPSHRRALMSNLFEESGQYCDDDLAALAVQGVKAEWIVGVPHPELFRRFRIALTEEDDSNEELEVQCWRDMLLSTLTMGSAAEAVGALGLGTELVVSTIYQPFLRAIARQRDLLPRDTAFFPLHTLVDDTHQAILREIAIDLAATESGRVDLACGMNKALMLRDSFWSWLHERALQCLQCDAF